MSAHPIPVGTRVRVLKTNALRIEESFGIVAQAPKGSSTLRDGEWVWVKLEKWPNPRLFKPAELEIVGEPTWSC